MSFHNTALIGASGQGGGYNLESSLRFRGGQNLRRTPLSTSNRRTYTLSFWLKRGAIGTSPYVFEQYYDANTRSILYINSSGTESFNMFSRIGGTNYQVQCNAVCRDPSAWYHLVISIDTTQATASNRVKIWVNGEQQTSLSVPAGYPPQNSDTAINTTGEFVIGGSQNNGSYGSYYDGYITEFNFVDGQALTPSDFGETDTITGVWKPKEYLGTYGTNGFYLPFTGEITPSVTAGFGGTAENVLYDDTSYLISNTTTGSSFDLVEYDFGESINMIDYNIQDLKFTGGTSTFRIYTSDVGGSLSNYTERASLSVSSSFQNYTGNLGVTARYVKIRATNFGTNGQAHLNYFNVDVDSSVFSDNSGNANNWTPNNINVVADMMNDVPTLTDEDIGNFATWNPLTKESSITTTNANLSFNATTTSGNHRLIRASHGMTSGKYYWEVNVNNSSNVDIVGVSSMDFNGNPLNNYVGGHLASAGYGYNTSNGQWYRNGFNLGSVTNPPAFPSSGIIGVAFDADNGKLYFHTNGTWINSADPVAGTNANFTASTIQSGYLPAISTYNNQGTWTANFGQRPFAYTPPTGFKKLNTYNLPDSTIKDGSQYFNPVLYTGNGTSQSITGVGFSPDLVWVKSRNTASYWHNLVDTVRGNTKYLFSNDTTSETTQTTYLTSFDSDGFSIGSNANWNNNGTTYVAWNWRASDSSPVTNTNGTITSTVSANTDSGFSVVSYTGNSTNGATIGHGLGVAPKIVIVKNRDGGWQWIVDISNITGTTSDHLLLNSTAAKNSSNTYFSAKPTSTVFSVNGASYSDTGTSPYKYIAYCFADVEGFSKFGSYTGNGSADGPFIYTGFDVKFLLYKNVDAAISWVIYDNVRDPNGNPQSYYLLPNSSGAEGTTPDAVDFLSNGFKIRYPNASINVTGQNHIYMAFAENPFKNSLAR